MKIPPFVHTFRITVCTLGCCAMLLSCPKPGISKILSDPSLILKKFATMLRKTQREGSCGFFDFGLKTEISKNVITETSSGGGAVKIRITNDAEGKAEFVYTNFSIDEYSQLDGKLEITEGNFFKDQSAGKVNGTLKLRMKKHHDFYMPKLVFHNFVINNSKKNCGTLKSVVTKSDSKHGSVILIYYTEPGPTQKKMEKIVEGDELLAILQPKFKEVILNEILKQFS